MANPKRSVKSVSSDDDRLVEEIWSKAKPKQFEKLLGRLLPAMGFSDVQVTGRSGDGGIDLRAIWTTNVPGLDVDLRFLIQAKKTKPVAPINPRYVRELKGILKSGEWGLLITTSKVSDATRRSAIEDPSRMVSILDGRKLAELCRTFRVGVRERFDVDLGFLEREPSAEEPAPILQEVEEGEHSTESVLSRALGETFERFGNSPIFKSPTRTILARWSQFYEKKWSNYWYGVTPKDIERLDEYDVNTYALACDNKGVVLLSAKELNKKIRQGELWRTPSHGDLRHYHLLLKEKEGKIYWQTKASDIDVTALFHAIK